MKTLGRPVDPQELVDAEPFPASEGMLELIYGRPRQGKTTETVRRIFESLMFGIPVYTNVILDLGSVEFDERRIPERTFRNFLFGKKRFYVFSKENYHYWSLSTGKCDGVQVFIPNDAEDCARWLSTLTDCEIYIDEGHHIVFSYEGTKQSLHKMALTTETGHFNRRIVLISQRTQAIHVNARGNVHIFYRCSKLPILWFSVLKVEEFNDMKGSDVDEEEPVSVKLHFFNKQVWGLYNTHALRNGRIRSQKVHFAAYDLGFFSRLMALFTSLRRVDPPEGGGDDNFTETPYKSVSEVIALSPKWSRFHDLKKLKVEGPMT